MKVAVLQHVPFEGLGSIEAWLPMRNAQIHITRFYETVVLPEIDSIDLVIAMGGSMSVNDEMQYPWLKLEKTFIRAAIERAIPVVGICLGAQLIASALNARVYANKEKEIGWFPIEAVAASPALFQFPSSQKVFHWHGETFDLPATATRLAKSEACENQAFQVGRNVIGLQFHLETTPATADLILQHCRDELVDGRFIQTEASIRAEPAASYATINQLMIAILDFAMAVDTHL